MDTYTLPVRLVPPVHFSLSSIHHVRIPQRALPSAHVESKTIAPPSAWDANILAICISKTLLRSRKRDEAKNLLAAVSK